MTGEGEFEWQREGEPRDEELELIELLTDWCLSLLKLTCWGELLGGQFFGDDMLVFEAAAWPRPEPWLIFFADKGWLGDENFCSW